MPLRTLSSAEAAWLLAQVGIVFKRQGKEDIFEGFHNGRVRVVVVPRNKRSIPPGTFGSILRQAGMTKSEAEEIWTRRK
ncbi:MAG: type II toxin-antitoxin system HicA family toxin [Chloroflexota bacterium]